MSDDRPALTLTEAAKATKVSRKTLRRRLDSDEFPNARRLDGPTGTGTGPWVIPIADLLSAGFTLHSPDDDRAEDKPDDHGVDLRIHDLEHELALERERRRAAEAIAAERAAALDDLRTALALAQRMLGTSAPTDSPTPTPEQRPGSSKSEPMLVTPEQESADADTLVVAELDQATRSVADLTEATLTGHTRRWRRSPKSGSEPMLVNPEQRPGSSERLSPLTLANGPTPDRTAPRPTRAPPTRRRWWHRSEPEQGDA